MKKLWSASKIQIINSNLFDYEKYIYRKYSQKFNKNYNKILNWTIKNPEKFWESVWDYCNVKGNKGKVNLTDKPKLFDYQFNHIFYKNNNSNSNFFNDLNPILDKLKPLSLIRIKANLNTPLEKGFFE